MRTPTLLFAALMTLVASCGGSGTVVATVEGVDISLRQVEELSTAGASGAVSQEQFVQDLRNAIIEVLVIEEAEQQFGISFSEEEIEARRAELETQIEGETGASYEGFLEERGFTDARIRRIAHQQLVAEAVEQELVSQAGPITEEEIEEAYDTQALNRTEACVSHILVETEEQALAARERIVEDGEDFAAVASELSTDPSAAENSGDLGCAPLGQYVPEFATAALEAELGEVTQPVRSQFGFHLIRVDSRETETLDEAREEITAFLDATRGQTLLQDWLLETVNQADIEVDPEYGQWVTEPSPQVLPPQ